MNYIDNDYLRSEIMLDSLHPVTGARITTFQLSYQRFFHSEFMTHRVFSRNASSSRAIPISKMISMVESKPSMPTVWGLNEKGMQATKIASDEVADKAIKVWEKAAMYACQCAREMDDLGIHKEIVNRLIENFTNINVIVTATDWDNYFNTRAHNDALPDFRNLAYKMQHQLKESVPSMLEMDSYHLPYVLDDERKMYTENILKEISAARCARVSFMNHMGVKPQLIEDTNLFQRLKNANPMHPSPMEHQARPSSKSEQDTLLERNLSDFVQFRAELESQANS